MIIRFICFALLFSFALTTHAQVSPGGDLFLKYYYQYKEVSKLENDPSEIKKRKQISVEMPKWFSSYCKKRKINDKFNFNNVTWLRLNKILDYFLDAHDYSSYGAPINMGLKLAKLQPEQAFEILKEIIDAFPGQFDFKNLERTNKDFEDFKKMVTEMPVIAESEMILPQGKFKFLFRHQEIYYAINIINEKGDLIFNDGPRTILNKNDPRNQILTASLTETWTNPEYRSLGLYQHGLLYYLNTLKVEQTYLYTENDETVEFLYRMQQVLYNTRKRIELLQIPGIEEYLLALGVDISKYVEGQKRPVKDAEEILSYLSLQGRTRLNLGMSFRLAYDDFARIYSRPLTYRRVENVKAAMKMLEAKIELALQGPQESFIRGLLPHSYLAKFKKKTDEIPTVSEAKSETVKPSCVELLKTKKD